MASARDLRQCIETTAHAFISAFERGSVQQDASAINRHATADCTRHLHPTSVPQAFGLAADFILDTAIFEATFAKEIKVLRYGSPIVSNLIIDVEARSAALTSVVTVRPNEGEEYDWEQAWFLYFTEDGSKVKKVVEFCDKDVILKLGAATV